MKKFILIILSLCFIVSINSGCASNYDLSQTQVLAQSPTIRVYNTATQTTSILDLEDYVAGVVAGEVYNTWNKEALKAQCILSRTYALKFAADNPEIYRTKGISTNILDAQNYDESTINSNVIEACNETRGQVLTYNGELLNAYFHSNSGGQTATLAEGFNTDENYAYIKSVSSPETSQNSKNYSWTATFSKSEVLNTLKNMGISLSNLSSASLGEKSANGYYKTINLGGKSVDTKTFRLNIGSTKFKSTKLTALKIENGSLVASGLGYGHGVGVSQWGAKILADQGKTCEEILKYYFNNVEITTI